MIKHIQTINWQEINVGDDLKNNFPEENFNNGEKVITEIREVNKGLNYQIFFKDGTMIETSFRKLTKIND